MRNTGSNHANWGDMWRLRGYSISDSCMHWTSLIEYYSTDDSVKKEPETFVERVTVINMYSNFDQICLSRLLSNGFHWDDCDVYT
jgi:hypothetical protein